MKLELDKDWFDRNIPYDNPEVAAGFPKITPDLGQYKCHPATGSFNVEAGELSDFLRKKP